MKKCPFCGADIEDSARFCLYCMRSLTEKEQVAPFKKKKIHWIIFIVAIVAIIVIIATLILTIGKSDGNASSQSEISSELNITSDSSLSSSDEYSEESKLNFDPTSDDSASSETPSDSEVSHTHNYSLQNTEAEYKKKDASCTAPAIYYYSCICGEKGSETFYYGALGEHIVVTDVGYPASCDKVGLTDGSHCSVCNVSFVSQTTIPVINHTFDNDRDDTCNVCNYVRVLNCNHEKTVKLDAIEPDCTSGGITEGLKCALCEEILIPHTILSPLGHKVVIDHAVSPTCTTDGKTEGSHCSVCQNYFVLQHTIYALGHSFDSNNLLAPCSVCGAPSPHIHNYSEENTAIEYQKEAATCIAPAVYYYSCICGEKGNKTFTYGSKGEHNIVTDIGYAPTCTETGLSDGTHCTVCPQTFIPQYPIRETGHTFEPGEDLPTCLVCGGKGSLIVTASELPIVHIDDKYTFQVNSCTYTIRKDTVEEKWQIEIYINYTNLSSERTHLGPTASLSVYVDGKRVTGYGPGTHYSVWLEPNESGTCKTSNRVTNIGDRYNIEIHE